MKLKEQLVREALVARDAYIKLLSDELSETSGLSYVHGWRSTRGKAGKACRKRIEKADKAM